MKPLLYRPILKITLLCIEVDTDLYYGLATSRKTLVVLLEVDLLHRSLGTLVEFQLDEIERVFGLHYHVHPTIRRMNLDIYHEVGQEGEDDEKHLLIMPLIVGIIAIRHCTQEFLK